MQRTVVEESAGVIGAELSFPSDAQSHASYAEIGLLIGVIASRAASFERQTKRKLPRFIAHHRDKRAAGALSSQKSVTGSARYQRLIDTLPARRIVHAGRRADVVGLPGGAVSPGRTDLLVGDQLLVFSSIGVGDRLPVAP